jgi:hypothetical protein
MCSTARSVSSNSRLITQRRRDSSRPPLLEAGLGEIVGRRVAGNATHTACRRSLDRRWELLRDLDLRLERTQTVVLLDTQWWLCASRAFGPERDHTIISQHGSHAASRCKTRCEGVPWESERRRARPPHRRRRQTSPPAAPRLCRSDQHWSSVVSYEGAVGVANHQRWPSGSLAPYSRCPYSWFLGSESMIAPAPFACAPGGHLYRVERRQAETRRPSRGSRGWRGCPRKR